jgi:hypothetical protein
MFLPVSGGAEIAGPGPEIAGVPQIFEVLAWLQLWLGGGGGICADFCPEIAGLGQEIAGLRPEIAGVMLLQHSILEGVYILLLPP